MKIAYNSLGSPATVQLFGTGGSTLSAYIQAFGVKPNQNSQRKDSIEYMIQSLRVEEFLATTMHPLLNYIFFEHNSAEIPTRYARISKEQARRYSEKSPFEQGFANRSTLEVYRNVLNIIGSRLRTYPEASITLIGCKATKERFTANEPAPRRRIQSREQKEVVSTTTATPMQISPPELAPATQETIGISSAISGIGIHPMATTTSMRVLSIGNLSASGDMRLSEARALAVKAYLMDVWGIAEERIKIMFRSLPEKPSTETTSDGVAENRRVEILSSEPGITDVITAADTLRAVVPPLVRFRTNAVSQVKLTGWQASIHQKNRREIYSLKEFSGTGKPLERLQWNTTFENNTAPKLNAPVHYTLSVLDESGASAVSSGSLPVEVVSIAKKRASQTADKEVNTFGLLLFDFNRAEIASYHERILAFVRQRLRSDSKVTIIGYTDRTGSILTNKTLSLQRARAAAAALERDDGLIEGRGSEGLLHDNNTPEGRFYCRTVNIIVENALK